MKEKATIYDLWRMCRHYDEMCDICPLYAKDCGLGIDVPIEEMEEINKIILNWCKKHPLKQDRISF